MKSKMHPEAVKKIIESFQHVAYQTPEKDFKNTLKGGQIKAKEILHEATEINNKLNEEEEKNAVIRDLNRLWE